MSRDAEGPIEITRRRFMQAAIGATLVPTLPGCGGPTEPRAEGDPRLTVVPHAPTLTAVIGAQELGLSVGPDGILYVPVGYDPAVPAPLLVALHGATRRASDWETFYEDCDELGIVLLAVDSRTRTWDRIGGFFGADVPFIDAAMNLTYDHVNIDPTRTALCGISDGATYTLSLGPNNGDLFPYLMAYSPGFTAPTEDLVGTPRIWVSHATDDPILPFDATQNDIVPALERAGYDVTFVEFLGGHTIPSTLARQSLDWFLA